MNYFKITIFTSMLALFGCVHESGVPGADPSSEAFLLDVQQRTFGYFWELTPQKTGLVPDRAPTESFSSVAATGFGLSSYIVGIENNFITREEGAQRVLNTLAFHYNGVQAPDSTGIMGYKGFFYHFLDMNTGNRFQQVELSTIDTALLMAGILSCQTYFDLDNPTENKIRRLADALYRRVDWTWALNKAGLLSMGWHPEKGFLEYSWSGYNEAMILLVLALGSPTHPIPSESWQKWTQTYNWTSFMGYEHVNFGPLFGHQYAHIFIDFRNIQDEYMRGKQIDYFENSRLATLANRAYCIENPSNFKGYGEKVWGLTASDGPGGGSKDTSIGLIEFHDYWARAAAKNEIRDDGTIAPTAAGGSIVFTPEASLETLQYISQTYGENIYSTYGFKDAFNLTYPSEGGWFDHDYLGIDQGPILLQIENYRTELIWDLMKKNPYIIKGLNKAGFAGGWLDEVNKKI